MEIKAPKSVKPKVKRRAHLPKQPFQNIAVSLSGGGFRATSIHLGLISYLSLKKIEGVSLLERVRILSSVSGGTFLGVKYAATIKKGGSFEDCYKNIVDFMTKKDLVEEALEYLAEDANWHTGRQRSLINSFAAMYHRDFESATFDLFWGEKQIHLKEINFNATEFHFALPFHFQKTELHSINTSIVEYIGNKKIQISSDVAREIRLADIIAASSCVPFGFEPINFPDDFTYPGSKKLNDKSLLPQMTYDGEKIVYPVGLMDGGVDDNQGVDAVITSEERMKNYPEHLHEFRSRDKKAVDLYIISDGTNPSMESYVRSNRDKVPFIDGWSFKLMQYIGISGFILGWVLIAIASFLDNKFAIMSLSMIGTLGILVAFVFLVLSRGFVGLAKRFGIPYFFIKRMRHVDKMKFGTLNNLLVNRRNSVVKMVTKVFIKQMRWFGFERVYSDTGWKPRLIMNAVFELTKEEVAKRKKKYPYFSPEIVEPGEKIMEVSARALTKGTTLWFTQEELKGKYSMADSIIACGQFTICFNLLEYFEKFILNPKYKKDYEKYSPETKEMLEELQKSLLVDWIKFKENPFWMVEEFRQKLW
ncbi:patatin-like phospholipase family protein [Aurantibacillus circumpalustris]|uniref:patatin-like phospholipase family protein n=1 Tax=Aurantibacillus circumpalustris TaxID=3036359 RepID=UPI00295BB534|nr:patatin-like phospholipase family protein [Aurantibacillus circumpalustris]